MQPDKTKIKSWQGAWARIRAASHEDDVAELLIYGDIGESWWGESVTAKDVVTQLQGITASKIRVCVNSYGGSVADGLAIYNALRRHSAEIEVVIDGVAVSIASLIAMAGDTVMMPANALYMVHAPWGMSVGNSQDMRDYADTLDTMADAMVSAYTRKVGDAKADDIRSLLKDGKDHWYTAAEAEAFGFIDMVTEAVSAAASASLPRNRFPTAPAAALAAPAIVPPEFPVMDPKAKEKQSASAPAAPATPVATPQPAASTPPAQDEAAIKAQFRKEENDRKAGIRDVFAMFRSQSGVSAIEDRCIDDSEVTVEKARAELLAHLGTQATPAAGRVETGTGLDETATRRQGAALAIMHRANPGAQLDERAQAFRGMNLLDLARECVAASGRNTRGMVAGEIARAALIGTSDLPSILENVVTKTLRDAYAGTARTFTAFSRQATLPNFKEVSRTQLSGAPSLKRIHEGGEYEYGTISDGAEKYAVLKYGIQLALTWETIVNDDLDALIRIPTAFGRSGADNESDIVYAILTGNPLMADGVALFDATHGNLGTATVLSDELGNTTSPLSEARKAMLLQKGLEGRHITVRPEYLIVPPSLEQTAVKITSRDFMASTAVDTNPLNRNLMAIVEPRLEDASATAYFLAANPAAIDTIEYAYLEGHEGVFTETKDGWDVDGMMIKCRQVFGAKAIDHRGLFKNAGA